MTKGRNTGLMLWKLERKCLCENCMINVGKESRVIEFKEQLRSFSFSSITGASHWPETYTLTGWILTLGKAGWVVIDVREGDVDSCGPS